MWLKAGRDGADWSNRVGVNWCHMWTTQLVGTAPHQDSVQILTKGRDS